MYGTLILYKYPESTDIPANWYPITQKTFGYDAYNFSRDVAYQILKNLEIQFRQYEFRMCKVIAYNLQI